MKDIYEALDVLTGFLDGYLDEEVEDKARIEAAESFLYAYVREKEGK